MSLFLQYPGNAADPRGYMRADRLLHHNCQLCHLWSQWAQQRVQKAPAHRRHQRALLLDRELHLWHGSILESSVVYPPKDRFIYYLDFSWNSECSFDMLFLMPCCCCIISPQFMYLIPVTLTVSVIAAFQLPAFTERQNLGAVTLLLVLFGWVIWCHNTCEYFWALQCFEAASRLTVSVVWADGKSDWTPNASMSLL